MATIEPVKPNLSDILRKAEEQLPIKKKQITSDDVMISASQTLESIANLTDELTRLADDLRDTIQHKLDHIRKVLNR